MERVLIADMLQTKFLGLFIPIQKTKTITIATRRRYNRTFGITAASAGSSELGGQVMDAEELGENKETRNYGGGKRQANNQAGCMCNPWQQGIGCHQVRSLRHH